MQHSAVQFSTSTFAVHYSTIQYQHICSTVLNIYSTFQVTCTFAAHYSTIQHQYFCSTLQEADKDGDTRSYFFTTDWTLCCIQNYYSTIAAHMLYKYSTFAAPVYFSTITAQLQHISAQLQHISAHSSLSITDKAGTKVWIPKGKSKPKRKH